MSQSSANQSFDTAREHLGKIYAKGLLGAAEGQNLIDRVLSELDSLIDDVLDQMDQFDQLLASPRIAPEEKNRILDEAFGGRMTSLLLNFLKVAAHHGRLDCLRQIRTAAHNLYNEMRGRVEVTVETAGEISGQLVGQIEQRLTIALGRQVELCCSVNPKLLGGLVVRVGDTVYDGSLDNRLDRMRDDTVGQTAELIRNSLQRFMVSDQ